MKKLLVLALLGLVFGAGAWKSQNPEGTIDDARAQATDVAARLKAGALTVMEVPAVTQTPAVTEISSSSAEVSVEDRLALIEESLTERESAAMVDGTRDARIDDLASSLQDALASTEANMVRLDAVDSRLELLVRRLDEQGVEMKLREMQQAIAAMTEQMNELRSNTDERESALSNEVAEAKEAATALDLRLNTLTTVTSEAPEENNSDTAAANTDGNASANSLSASLDQRFTALESRLASVNSDARQVKTLNDQLEAANARITQLQQDNTVTQSALAELNSTMADLKTAGESLSIDTVQAEIRDQLALLQSQFETSVESDNAAALQNLLNTTRTRIQELEERVRDLPAASSEATSAQDTQSALETQIVSLERRLEEISNADPEIASTLSNVQAKVNEIASKGYVTQEDLRTQKEQKAVQYKIYFERNSVEITDAAAAVLDSFIAQEKNRTTGVSIFGFTDRLGSATYNQQLALQRATNVRSYLIQNGLDYTKIKAMSGLGEDAAAAVLPDDAGDAQQRVVVLFAAQP